MLPSTFHCTECGGPIRGSAGLGLCGSCALRGAIGLEAPDREAEPEQGPDGPGRFGDYDLLEEVARGGMGVVYRARQRSLGRVVALKVLLGGAFAGEDGKRRLQAEATAAARLQHPNIVAVHDAGLIDGQPFFSMTLVEGPTLADVVRSGALPAQRAARYVARIAEAVHYAHTQGVLHRDLKPSNVLLDANDEPHVTDFGLAKSLVAADVRRLTFKTATTDSVSEDDQRLLTSAATKDITLTGQVLGSPAYMAPEQATGRSAELGPASDVYSLGAILYEMLAGRPPFLGETPHTVIEQVKTIDPIPVRRLKQGIPADLETVCLKCLEKEPRRRYATARELADELNRFLRGELVQARPVGPAGRAWRWMQRHRALSLSLTLVVLLLAGGAVGSTLAALRIKRAERSAVAGLRESLVEQARGRRLTGGLGARTETLDSLRRAAALDLDEEQRLRARNEAIAALALDEVRFVPQPQLPRSPLVRTALDPTFRWLARVESNNTVVVHQVSDGDEFARWLNASVRRPLNGQPEFSADGNHLAVLFRDRLNIWAVTNGALCFSNPGATNVYAFSGDGRSFALAHPDGSVTLRELPSGRVLHRLIPGVAVPTTPTTDARRLGLSSDGRRLAVVQSMTNCVDVFDFESGERLWRMAEGVGAKNVTWNRDDTLLGVSCESGLIQVWDTRTGKLRHLFPQGNDASRCLAFHPDEPLLAAVSPQRHLDVRHKLTGRLLAEAPVDANKVSFNQDGSRLGPVWMGGQIGWLETSVSSNFRAIPVGSPQTPYWRVSFSPSASVLAVCSHHELTLIDTETLVPLAVMTNRAFHFARFDHAGFLWTIDRAGVHRWRPGLSRSLNFKWSRLETRWPGSEWRWLDFSADGQWMAAANRQISRLVITPHHASTNEVRIGSHFGARWVALSREARYAVTGSLDAKRLKLWDVQRNEMRLDLPVGGNGGRAAFSPDGRWLATFGEEGLLWSAGQWTNAAATLFPSGETGLGDGVFSADSRRLAVVANLREIHLFDVASARRDAIFQAPEAQAIQAIALTPDGRWLVALCKGGWLQRWDLKGLRQELAELHLEW